MVAEAHARLTRTHCRSGHDLAVVGRYSDGRCAECKRERQRARRRAQREGRPRPGRILLDPSRLVALIGERWPSTAAAAHAYADRYGQPWQHAHRQLLRMRRGQRVGIDTADAWCVLLDVPLACIYPEVYAVP